MTTPTMMLPDFVLYRGPYVGLEPGAFVYRLDESLLLKTVRVRDLEGGITSSSVHGCGAPVPPISQGDCYDPLA